MTSFDVYLTQYDAVALLNASCLRSRQITLYKSEQAAHKSGSFHRQVTTLRGPCVLLVVSTIFLATDNPRSTPASRAGSTAPNARIPVRSQRC